MSRNAEEVGLRGIPRLATYPQVVVRSQRAAGRYAVSVPFRPYSP